ncbi:MAG: hypothetical protein M1269_00020 [Chloroflexi bacterium]|nr:hypothetical protein [Chloroflexota bacterium]
MKKKIKIKNLFIKADITGAGQVRILKNSIKSGLFNLSAGDIAKSPVSYREFRRCPRMGYVDNLSCKKLSKVPA